MKEHIPIRPPMLCIEEGCVQPAKRRRLCLMHYQRLRYRAKKEGTWEPRPSGNFGDPEGHRLSAKMGGDKRAEDREGLREAGRIGARRCAEKHPELLGELAKLGGAKTASNPEYMRELARKGREARWGKRKKADGEKDGDPSEGDENPSA